MARIPMTSGFVIIPEGEYVFRIYDATYDEDFGRIEIKLVNAQGATHTERFSIKDKNDEYNEKALNAFSYFAKTAMNDYTMEDIDPEQLINHYIRAEVVHTKVPSNKDPNKEVTFANLGDKSPSLSLVRSLSAVLTMPLRKPHLRHRLLPLRLRLDWILTHCWVKQSAGRGKLLSRIFNRRCRMTDNVNHPAHYETGKFECIEVMLETQGVEATKDFCVCNALKYIYRHRNKNGVEDIKKADWYLKKYLELAKSQEEKA